MPDPIVSIYEATKILIKAPAPDIYVPMITFIPRCAKVHVKTPVTGQ